MSRIPKIGLTTSTPTDLAEESKVPKLGLASVPLICNASKETRVTAPPFGKPMDPPPKTGIKRTHENEALGVNKKSRTVLPAAKRMPLSTLQPSLRKQSAIGSFRSGVPPVSRVITARESMPATISVPLASAVPKKKRPAWDLKGRIQDMEENFQKTQKHNVGLENQLELYNQRIAVLESANSQLHEDVEIKSVQSQEATSEVKRLEEELKNKSDELQKLRVEKISIQNQFDEQTSEVTSLRSMVSSLVGQKNSLQAKLDSQELVIQQQRQNIDELGQIKASLESEIVTLTQENDNLEAKQREAESERRMLHNTIQELKGNIRVYCRMRPPLPEEIKNGLAVADISPLNEKTLGINQNTDDKKLPKHEFNFDRIFLPTDTQASVFQEISQLVQSSLDGYNVCVFAYGQTGSGKTYTMEGPDNITDFAAPDDMRLGMIPRSVQQVFEAAEKLESKGWTYKIEVSFLEVYNETIQDLLSNSKDGSNKCKIKKSGGKGVDSLVSNVTTLVVENPQQVYDLLKKARTSRVVAATKSNKHSSRSHYVFQMKMPGENRITSEKCDGTLNLVDLAGSERIKDSGSEGDRLTEAKNINKSLSNLGNVIMALSQKDTHVPYRNSKLTHLLMNSLGGNSKTLMFVNISPDVDNISETINSLRFATKVNECNIGTAQRRTK